MYKIGRRIGSKNRSILSYRTIFDALHPTINFVNDLDFHFFQQKMFIYYYFRVRLGVRTIPGPSAAARTG